MPQTSYPLDISPACSGQVVRADTYSGRYIAEEDIPAGRLVALNAATGQLRLPRHSDKILGVAPYRPTQQILLSGGGGYHAGDQVAVVRRGQAWVESVGTTPTSTALQTPNVSASTTIATDRGKVTASATNATAGTEIDALTAGVECVKTAAAATSPFGMSSSALALLSFDFPAN